ncbi:MotA/TolQ/ExbB proton channel family protein [Corallincola spongiicola]|uniref:MotA/TolQ/ExbB proton channel family protein n=1 Tax=Corallincola spongiicola TaxID=2520508 RepID=A0ABY1WSH3_9GAMM|nr:MotA/TolQ/ExbB proton channel family protein [Corallincola spongiicola]TAA47695.1 MotA/TolQ/ExbB proton channel family protein [Corallincola spongiicola]
MRKVLVSISVAAAVLFTALPASANVASLDQLLKQVKQDRISERKLNKEREQEFLDERADKLSLLKKAKRAQAAEEARQVKLQKQFNANELALVEKETELENAKGTLGEMFGVVRQAAGDTVGRISTSIVSAQYKGRGELLSKLAEAKELPTLKELEDLWFALQTEMTESGKVVKFNAEVVELEGGSTEQTVTRVGTFNLLGEDKYLLFGSDTGTVQPLGRQPDGYIVGAVSTFNQATAGFEPLYIDPSQGLILGLQTAKATITERYHQGGLVGYIITGVLALGFLIAIERFITLGLIGAKIRRQLKNTDVPNEGNPLGRILKVYQENKASDTENLELKLDEAVLRETPRIERGVAIIKILAAIAPLLGLLGTVTGMIKTFESITLFGTGDPKVMAGSISMALVTTAQGLIAALPLILVHSLVAARSKSIVQVLDEQSAGIVAAHAEQEKA